MTTNEHYDFGTIKHIQKYLAKEPQQHQLEIIEQIKSLVEWANNPAILPDWMLQLKIARRRFNT